MTKIIPVAHLWFSVYFRHEDTHDTIMCVRVRVCVGLLVCASARARTFESVCISLCVRARM